MKFDLSSPYLVASLFLGSSLLSPGVHAECCLSSTGSPCPEGYTVEDLGGMMDLGNNVICTSGSCEIGTITNTADGVTIGGVPDCAEAPASAPTAAEAPASAPTAAEAPASAPTAAEAPASAPTAAMRGGPGPDGCIPGMDWCPELNTCIRGFEETCPIADGTAFLGGATLDCSGPGRCATDTLCEWTDGSASFATYYWTNIDGPVTLPEGCTGITCVGCVSSDATADATTEMNMEMDADMDAADDKEMDTVMNGGDTSMSDTEDKGAQEDCCLSMDGTCPEGYNAGITMNEVAVCGKSGAGCSISGMTVTADGVTFSGERPPDCVAGDTGDATSSATDDMSDMGDTDKGEDHDHSECAEFDQMHEAENACIVANGCTGCQDQDFGDDCVSNKKEHCAEIKCCPACEAEIRAMFGCEHGAECGDDLGSCEDDEDGHGHSDTEHEGDHEDAGDTGDATSSATVAMAMKNLATFAAAIAVMQVL